MSETILQRLQDQIQKQGIQIKINETPPYYSGYTVLDIEHDEQGNFVGVGCLIPGYNTVWYFTKFPLNFKLGKIIGHNVISDIEMLKFWGLPIKDGDMYWDTMLMGHILDSSKKDYSLKAMAKRECGIEYPEYDEIVGKHKGKTLKHPKCPRTEAGCCGRITLDKQPIEIVSLYNALDVHSTYKLYELQRKALANGPL